MTILHQGSILHESNKKKAIKKTLTDNLMKKLKEKKIRVLVTISVSSISGSKLTKKNITI